MSKTIYTSDCNTTITSFANGKGGLHYQVTWNADTYIVFATEAEAVAFAVLVDKRIETK